MNFVRNNNLSVIPGELLGFRCQIENSSAQDFYIDDVRVRPVNSVMTTNTYKPLTGPLTKRYFDWQHLQTPRTPSFST